MLKQPKKPTRQQKETIRAAGLDWKSWSVARETETTFTIVNKKSGTMRVLRKWEGR